MVGTGPVPESRNVRGLKLKPFKCDYPRCAGKVKAFESRHKLNRHMQTHLPKEQRKKPIKCRVEGCNETFTQKCNMEDHARKHLGEKQLECQTGDCKYTAACSGNLVRHKKQMHAYATGRSVNVDDEPDSSAETGGAGSSPNPTMASAPPFLEAAQASSTALELPPAYNGVGNSPTHGNAETYFSDQAANTNAFVPHFSEVTQGSQFFTNHANTAAFAQSFPEFVTQPSTTDFSESLTDFNSAGNTGFNYPVTPPGNTGNTEGLNGLHFSNHPFEYESFPAHNNYHYGYSNDFDHSADPNTFPYNNIDPNLLYYNEFHDSNSSNPYGGV